MNPQYADVILTDGRGAAFDVLQNVETTDWELAEQRLYGMKGWRWAEVHRPGLPTKTISRRHCGWRSKNTTTTTKEQANGSTHQ